uniref:Kynurenine formamidase-like hydrolase fscH n=1 Tax=Fusarium equiseti TaxID=61235 RepID=FSCH_FUSEQ|nr:TPA_asm: kynurenine formamidase-like hydrolase [Fusarium equiseti]
MEQHFEHLSCIPYLENTEASRYQTLDIWIPTRHQHGDSTHGYWIIFIHGGAWRDPDINATNFAEKAVLDLITSGVSQIIEGIASINYRLSPRTPSQPVPSGGHVGGEQQAMHPDHLNDVISGIEYLQRKFRFGNRYILTGHSCGATLAYQTLIRQTMDKTETHAAPHAIIGVAGLYDLPLLRDMDPMPPMCHQFLLAAFGSDETLWRDVSPATYGDFERLWPTGKLAVLVYCEDDEYVSPAQLNTMYHALEIWGEKEGRLVKTLKLPGGHDEVWRTGSGLASCVEKSINYLQDLSVSEA